MRNLFILIILVLLSCKPTKESLIGTYNRYWDFENYTTLQLEENYTFSFSGQQGLLFLKTKGTWRIERQNLVLNSYPDSVINEPSILVSEHTTLQDSIFINVLDDAYGELPGANIVAFKGVDTVAKDYTRIDGRSTLKKTYYDSIQISFIAFNPFTYTGTGDSITVKMNLSPPHDFRFDNEVWKIKGNVLLDPRFKNDQRKNKYKKKKTSNSTYLGVFRGILKRNAISIGHLQVYSYKNQGK